MSLLPGWGKYIDFTIDGSKVTSTLTDFAVPLAFGTSVGISGADNTAIFDEIGASYLKMAVTVHSESAATECYVEIEDWDSGAEKALIWIKAASLSSSGNPVIRIYYDSTHADNTTYVGLVTSAVAQNVWDSDTSGRWGMAQDPSGGASCIKDSTGNANHGTPAGTMLSGDLVDANIGKGLDLDGNDDEIAIAHTTDLSFADVDSTYTAMIKTNGANPGNNRRCFIGTGNTYLPNTYGDFFRIGNNAAGSSMNVSIMAGTGTPSWSELVGSAITDGVWTHLTYTYKVGAICEIFINGLSDTSTDFTPLRHADTDSPFYIGRGSVATTGRKFKGIISDIKIDIVARSDAWILTLANGQLDSLGTFSAEQQAPQVDDGDIITWSVLEQDLITESIITALEKITDSAEILSWSGPDAGEKITESGEIITWSAISAVENIAETCEIITESILEADEFNAVVSYPPRFYFQFWTDEKYYEWFPFRPFFVPISSFQARHSYKIIWLPDIGMRALHSISLSVTIPGIDYAGEIAAVPTNFTSMRLYMQILNEGVLSLRKFLPDIPILAYTISGISESTGMSVTVNDNSSISLSGSRTYVDLYPDTAPVHYLNNYTSSTVTDGEYKYRFPMPDPWIRSADYVVIDGNTIRVSSITYACSIDSGGLIMDLSGV